MDTFVHIGPHSATRRSSFLIAPILNCFKQSCKGTADTLSRQIYCLGFMGGAILLPVGAPLNHLNPQSHNVTYLSCIGGDPGSDFFFSPLEPAFWLHHQQLDRLYFVWQNLDWKNRQVRFVSLISVPLADTKLFRILQEVVRGQIFPSARMRHWTMSFSLSPLTGRGL
jgi:hypothetical protein